MSFIEAPDNGGAADGPTCDASLTKAVKDKGAGQSGEENQGDDVSTNSTTDSPTSSFLPQSTFSPTREERVGLSIEECEEEMPSRQADDPLRKSQPHTPARCERRSSLPTKPILKAGLNETIPIKTEKKYWSKLPPPDLQIVFMKRVESLNSFFHLDPSDIIAVADAASAAYSLEKMESNKVNFENVTVREYQQTIGDNPSVSYGTPVTLDWVYEECEPLDLNDYEANRGCRRSSRQMFMNHYQRKNLLIHKCGFTEEEVKAAKYQTNRVRSQRNFSKMIQISFRPLLVLEEIRESAVRKYKRKKDGKKSVDR